MQRNFCFFYLNVINRYNRSAQNIKAFENFFDLFKKNVVKKFQALRIKTLTFCAPRFCNRYDI
jgi:hypothetical protein